MNKVIKILMFGMLMSSIFAGCSTKSNPTLACFKGNPACYTQHIELPKETCVTCVAVI